MAEEEGVNLQGFLEWVRYFKAVSDELGIIPPPPLLPKLPRLLELPAPPRRRIEELPTLKEEKRVETRKCPSCGAEVPKTSKFCPECGEPLTSYERYKKHHPRHSRIQL